MPTPVSPPAPAAPRFNLHARSSAAVTAAVALGLLALAVFVTWRRYQQLAESPFPLGIDGYFYPIQLRAIIENGVIDSPAPPLAFYLMAPFAWVTDPIVGAKLGAAWWCAAAVFPAYGVAQRLSGFRTTGLIAAALVGLCHGGFYLTLEFVKNGVGITVALTLVWLLLRALETPSRTRIA
ncbi:MAG: glycosyltransferase family 39 protein, partial [Kofleriaceae bacterium]|nr:glycosyltransferase family 39 protein [Kofleriaceae bacterium]